MVPVVKLESLPLRTSHINFSSYKRGIEPSPLARHSYEDPLRVKIDNVWEKYSETLKPHETVQTGLDYYEPPEITHEVEMWHGIMAIYSEVG